MRPSCDLCAMPCDDSDGPRQVVDRAPIARPDSGAGVRARPAHRPDLARIPPPPSSDQDCWPFRLTAGAQN